LWPKGVPVLDAFALTDMILQMSDGQMQAVAAMLAAQRPLPSS